MFKQLMRTKGVQLELKAEFIDVESMVVPNVDEKVGRTRVEIESKVIEEEIQCSSQIQIIKVTTICTQPRTH
jgi:7-keto-8-aminopelargonate synthetase-like enzyme